MLKCKKFLHSIIKRVFNASFGGQEFFLFIIKFENNPTLKTYQLLPQLYRQSLTVDIFYSWISIRFHFWSLSFYKNLQLRLHLSCFDFQSHKLEFLIFSAHVRYFSLFNLLPCLPLNIYHD